MGKGIGIKCLTCGHEWEHFFGVGMSGQPAVNEDDTIKALTPYDREVLVLKCPKCGCLNVERKRMVILWD